MKVGLLWYDADPRRGLGAKVERAARCYREKYGHWPNTCYVHKQAGLSRTQEEATVTCGAEGAGEKVRLLSAQNILLNHFWLGVSTLKSEHKPVDSAG
jgi:hypothetical protein